MKPLYLRIRETLASEIADRSLAPGTQLAGEGDLARRFGCARMTIAKALQGLADQGLVERRRGVGTFVVDRFRDTAPEVEVERGPQAGGLAASPAGAPHDPPALQGAAMHDSTHEGSEFFAIWTVYNEVRRRSGSAFEIASRIGIPPERVERCLEELQNQGHVEVEAIDDDSQLIRYESVQPPPYASIQKTMGVESELHSRNVALEKTRGHIVDRFDEERAGRTDFDYFTINAGVLADDVSLHELQAMVLSWIELHRTKRRDVPLTHITFLTTPVRPRDWSPDTQRLGHTVEVDRTDPGRRD